MLLNRKKLHFQIFYNVKTILITTIIFLVIIVPIICFTLFNTKEISMKINFNQHINFIKKNLTFESKKIF